MIFIVEINIPRVLFPNSDDWHDESGAGSRRMIFMIIGYGCILNQRKKKPETRQEAVLKGRH
jgi:hypothetical protein